MIPDSSISHWCGADMAMPLTDTSTPVHCSGEEATGVNGSAMEVEDLNQDNLDADDRTLNVDLEEPVLLDQVCLCFLSS